ncbi:biotin/lipoyl-containing protein [Fonticella tunisiensis]|uniref:Biotin-dependent enzyme n=1 Tax=Fonticella tunisiensis TaxID=1096341 RepID=A0A4R7KAA4_9CLOT|nr:biotin/lipoyl-containing protein [Fonticella tunisiensis]TDT50314.1 biotin-dependent enzyme [Fonticella tunisiensis]
MKRYIVTVNGKRFEVEVEEAGESTVPIERVQAVQEMPKTPAEHAAPGPASSAVHQIIKAPMPGRILDVRVSLGQEVKKGDVLFILEAMKMENEIMAGEEGTVINILVSRGASVNTGDVLAVLE